MSGVQSDGANCGSEVGAQDSYPVPYISPRALIDVHPSGIMLLDCFDKHVYLENLGRRLPSCGKVSEKLVLHVMHMNKKLYDTLEAQSFYERLE